MRNVRRTFHLSHYMSSSVYSVVNASFITENTEQNDKLKVCRTDPTSPFCSGYFQQFRDLGVAFFIGDD